MRRAIWAIAAAALAAGCETAPKTASEQDALHKDVEATIARVNEEDPTFKKFFDSAMGYAVFPNVGKGAFGVGGAYGKGELYEKGKMVGWCDLSQGSIGLTVGGQTYSELIFFQTRSALDKFKSGSFEFAGQASGVIVRAGGAANADYENGVAVFAMPKAGLMGEAAIGGQNFTFKPKPAG